jgi:hypothetical protein
MYSHRNDVFAVLDLRSLDTLLVFTAIAAACLRLTYSGALHM